MSGAGIENLLDYALQIWANTLSIILNVLTTPLDKMFDGNVWAVIKTVCQALQAIGTTILIICFLMGVVNALSSMVDTRRGENAAKVFIRFIIAKEVVTRGLDIMLGLMSFSQSLVIKVIDATGIKNTIAKAAGNNHVPSDIIDSISDANLMTRIGCWLIALLAIVVMIVVCTVILLTVYSRFFKLYIYTAISPIPLATFGAVSTSKVGKGFLRSYGAICLEAVVIVLACVIFTAISQSTGGLGLDGVIGEGADASGKLLSYSIQHIISMLILLAVIKASDRLVREFMSV